MRKPGCGALVALSLCLGPRASLAVEAEPIVAAVEVLRHEQSARLVLTVKGRIDFKAFLLDNPYRLVVDLPELRWLPAAVAGRDAGPVTGWRFGKFTSARTRMVLDLDRPMRIARSELEAGTAAATKLVIQLETVSKSQFARASEDDSRSPPYTSPDHDGQRSTGERDALPLIVLDPGHGGIDPGSTGPSGIHEKDVILSLARDLREALATTKRYRVILTRQGDYYIPLRQRFEMARAIQATLFVSLHADASPFRGDRGISVYTLSGKASDAVAAELARRENRSDAVAGINLADSNERVAGILVDLAQRQSLAQAARLAVTLLPELRRVGPLVPGSAHRSAGFAVLKAPDVPSVLIEVGHLSNPKEEKLLLDTAYRARLAASIVRGIDRYLGDQALGGRRPESEAAER